MNRMSDLISRQAAIDALGTPHGILYPIRTVEALPSAQTEHATCYLDSPCEYQNINIALPSAEPNKEQEKAGEWEMFELITSVYYGKQYYFKQENGVVYSRASHKYMPVDDAVQEFLDLIGE